MECKTISLAFERSKGEKFQAITSKFTAEHKNSIYEAVRKCYNGNDLVLDLDFSNDSSPELPPAFRNPPEFEIFPANIFWNREKEKVCYNDITIANFAVLEFLCTRISEFLESNRHLIIGSSRTWAGVNPTTPMKISKT